MKTTETHCTHEFTRLTLSLCFTTYVVTTMKSPHLLSTVHDLTICTRSVQSSQKRRFHHYDSDCCLNHTWPSFHTDRIDRAAVSPTTLAALAPASHTSSTSVCRFHACKLHQFHQRLQVSITPVPSGFHAVVRILDILHGVRARFI